jgi:hypothetical protein
MEFLGAAFALPGIVIHELGHFLLCRLFGAKVQEVVFFQARGPSGYVVHTVPKRLTQHAIIVIGPLLVNSTLAFLLFRAATVALPGALEDLAAMLPLPSIEVLVLSILGASISLHALPSLADAHSLWRETLAHLGRGQLLAIFAAPIAGALVVTNHLRRYWIDWLYALALAGVAIWFPAN